MQYLAAILAALILANPVIAASPPGYQDGDLVFRRGAGLFSDIARHFSSTDKRFSHVGFIIHQHQTMHVIHSIHEDARGFNGVIIEKLSDYLDGIQDWAVYRFKLPRQQQLEMALVAADFARQKIPFDPHFDLSTSNAMYCTEFIWRVANEVAQPNPVQPGVYKMGELYITLEDIYNKNNTQLIDSASFHKTRITVSPEN